ncbi:acyl carrier protein [Streptomyces sp. NPDC048523]|uniref:acyl carrier protein n=1 Tax=unclassified Streptomyces TaxID=2593676 RepID=UPI00332CC24A
MPAAEPAVLDHVITIYRRVLEEDTVHPDSDFFDLGGDSLLATRVISAVARDLGVELNIVDFIDAATPRGVVELIASVTA